MQIERQIERTQITQGWEQDDQGRGRDRELEVQRYQDQRYEAAVAFEQRLHEIQMRRFDMQDQRMGLQEQRLALQEAQLAAQEARLNTNKKLQEDLNKLEDERFKAQYEQAQVQMVDDEKLEKLRKAARDAEIAYQGLQLEHAKTMKENEEVFLDSIKGIKEGGVLDKWIEFFNSVRAGPPVPVYDGADPLGDGAGSTSGNGAGSKSGKGGGQTAGPVAIPTVTQPRMPDMNISRDLAGASAAPTIVNFVLDGEVIMSAVVKPERLRPVVQEINRRDSWR
jgi:hypothetical protein